jgi:hypothetical protein
MVVGIAVGPRNVVGLDGGFSIPHHQIQDGDHPAQDREDPEKSDGLQTAQDGGFPVHGLGLFSGQGPHDGRTMSLLNY